MNKYERKPEFVLDLHGYTTAESKIFLDELYSEKKYSYIRIITGKCTYRETRPVLLPFVKKYLTQKNARFMPAKICNGGAGALEVFL